MSANADITFWIAFSAGILSFFSPCVLPLIPSYLTYITGISFGQLKDAHPSTKVRMSVVFHSLIFILGFSLVFVTMGAIAGWASHSFQSHPFIGWRNTTLKGSISDKGSAPVVKALVRLDY